MVIIQYLLEIIQFLYQQNCWLISFICKYIPLKQRAFDDSHSPKYQKLKVDELPLILNVEPWDYHDFMAYLKWRYKDDYKPIKPIHRRSECDIDDDCKCPHCMHTLVPKKDRKHFIVHKCINPKCPYYVKNLKNVDKQDLEVDYGKNKYKLHYIYREFTIDFFKMDLNSLPKGASSLKFSKFDKKWQLLIFLGQQTIQNIQTQNCN